MTEYMLIIIHPTESARRFPMQGWLVTIGRMESNDLVLPGEAVADKHAMLERKGDKWLARDMDSRSGTFLANHSLLPGVPEEWAPGEELRIGEYRLQLMELPDPTPPPAPTTTAPSGVSTAPRLQLSPATVMARLGEPVEMMLEVENPAAAPVEVALSATGIPLEWLTIPSGAIRIGSQQRLKLSLLAQPPRDSTATAGRHAFEIVAETAEGRGHATGELVVPPFSQPVLTVAPAPLRHGRPATIRIDNTANTPADFDLQAVDANRELVFDLPETRLSLRPGESGTASLTARAIKRPLALNGRSVPMEVWAKSGAANLTKTAQVIVPPRIPTLLLLVLGLPLLAALFFAGRGVLCQRQITRLTNTRYDQLCGLLPTVTPAAEEPTIAPTVAAQVTEELPGAVPVSPSPTVPALGLVVCEGAPPTQLTLGGGAQVSNLVGTTTLLVRHQPQPGSAAENVACELREGRVVDVLEGPVCDGNGHLMYRVRSRDNDVICEAGGARTVAEGWAIEGDTSFYYLVPVE